MKKPIIFMSKNIKKNKVALNPLHKIVKTLQQVASYGYHSSIITNKGSPSFFVSYKHLRVFIRGCTVAIMVSCYINQMTINCLTMIGLLCDTSIVAPCNKE